MHLASALLGFDRGKAHLRRRGAPRCRLCKWTSPGDARVEPWTTKGPAPRSPRALRSSSARADATSPRCPGENESTFGCALDGGDWTPCTSPQAYSGMSEAEHHFAVRATDSAGNVDPTPATRSWRADVAPPAARMTSGPPAIAPSTEAKFAFDSPGGGDVGSAVRSTVATGARAARPSDIRLDRGHAQLRRPAADAPAITTRPRGRE